MKREKYIATALLVTASLFLLKSCRTIPKGATAVKPFEVKKYLGKWYEVARMDYVFERNLEHTTAEYSMKKNGNIQVVNKGRNEKSGKLKEAKGKAKFVGDSDEGKLKVSFFGPFYSGYNIIALDEDYTYALVAGKNLKYLWILSRTPNIPDSIKNDFLKKAESLGYKTGELIWVKQD